MLLALATPRRAIGICRFCVEPDLGDGSRWSYNSMLHAPTFVTEANPADEFFFSLSLTPIDIR